MIRGRPCRLALVLAVGVAACAPARAQTSASRDTVVPLHAPAVIDSAAGRTAPHGRDAAIPAHADSARAHGRFDDAARWSRAWDDPERDGWQDPQRVVDLLRLRPGMRVADIGAGTGYFNPFLSRAVGPDGLVFAADIESTLVAHMQSRAEAESTANVRPVLAAPDDPRIPVARLDRVLLVNTYHHVDGRIGYFRRLRRLLDENSLRRDRRLVARAACSRPGAGAQGHSRGSDGGDARRRVQGGRASGSALSVRLGLPTPALKEVERRCARC